MGRLDGSVSGDASGMRVGSPSHSSGRDLDGMPGRLGVRGCERYEGWFTVS
jgi:hypothetical protein